MTTEQLVQAFDPADLLPTFVAMAPYILGVAAVVLVIEIIKSGIKTAGRSMSDPYNSRSERMLEAWRSRR